MKKIKSTRIKRVTRTLTLEEFVKLKETSKEIEFLRFLGKTANFSLLFSAGAKVFANSSLNSLSPKEASDMVDNLDLKELQRDVVYNGKLTREEVSDKYFLDRFTLATYIRKGFREAYPGLLSLADKRRGEASKRGYVRSTHGALRRLPEMHLAGKHDKGNPELFTLFSISINAPVQNFEAFVVYTRLGYAIWQWLLKTKKKTRIWNFVHDSINLYIHKDEAQEVITKIIELAEKHYPEYGKVKLKIDGRIADYWGKGELWKEGSDMRVFL